MSERQHAGATPYPSRSGEVMDGPAHVVPGPRGGLWERPPQLNALIDGQCWRGEVLLSMVVPTSVDSHLGGRLVAAAEREDMAGSEWVILHLPFPVFEGTYVLDGTSTDVVLFHRPAQRTGKCRSWSPSVTDAGVLCIDRVEPTSGMIEGSFGFTAWPLDDPASLPRRVTVGRFVIQAPMA